MDALTTFLNAHHVHLVDTEDQVKGRMVCAQQPLPCGSTVITSQPLGTVPFLDNRRECCNYCFRKPAQLSLLQRCSRCKSCYFCSASCFKRAWASHHQFVCKKQYEDNQDLTMIMLEIVALYIGRYRSHGEFKSPDEETEESDQVTMEAFLSLMDHRDKQPRNVMTRFEQIAQVAFNKPYIQQTGLSKEELVQLLCRFQCNNFHIHDDQLFAIGDGTYPIASLFNHSCRPNAVAMFDGALLSIKALQDIAAGDEITLTYVDIANARKTRQHILNEKYFFKCHCPRCDVEGSLGQIDTMLGEEASDWDRAQALLDSTSSKQSGPFCHIDNWEMEDLCHVGSDVPLVSDAKGVSLLSFTRYFLNHLVPQVWGYTWQPYREDGELFTRASDVEPRDMLVGRTVADLLDCSHHSPPPYSLETMMIATRLLYDEMSEGHWASAVKSGLYVLVQYVIVYPPYHPMLARHILVLANSFWNAFVQSESPGSEYHRWNKLYFEWTQRWIALGKHVIQCTFDQHSETWRELQELEKVSQC